MSKAPQQSKSRKKKEKPTTEILRKILMVLYTKMPHSTVQIAVKALDRTRNNLPSERFELTTEHRKEAHTESCIGKARKQAKTLFFSQEKIKHKGNECEVNVAL